MLQLRVTCVIHLQVEKVKETNRKAQRRYRDRQREKLAAAEDRVAELTNQLSRLQTEKVTQCTFNVLERA